MMKKTIFLLTFLILIFSNFFGFAEGENIELFKKGNKFYASGKYEEAIINYEKILNSGYKSSDLYFNLGNAYYRSNKFTYSIYFYEKAKILSPDDNEIKDNLEMANRQIKDKITEIPDFFLVEFIENTINSKSEIFWAYMSLSIFALSLSAILLFLFSKIKIIKIISFFVGILFFLLSISTFIFAKKQYYNLNANNTAIIFTSSVWVKSSPGEGASELFNIHEGLKVNIKDKSNDWYEIELADGRDGWIKKNDLKII